MSSRHIREPLTFNTIKNLTEAGDYTVVNESVVLVNKSSGAATTINLPAVSSAGGRRCILVVDAKGDAATNNITIDASGSENINGATTYVINENYGSVLLIDDGTEWIIAAQSNDVSATELGYLDVTLGTGTASKAVTLDANGDYYHPNNGGVVIGHTAQVTVSDGDGDTNLVPELQILGTAKADSSILLACFSTTDTAAVAPSFNFLKSGHGTIGTLTTIVANAEILGQIQFLGCDGVDGESCGARIHSAVDGTPGAGDMPANLVFSTTPDGSETPTVRLTLSAQGLATLAASTTPASVASTPGTNAGTVLTATGGAGGVSSNASGTGGVGGGFSFTAGVGGACSGTTAPTGGAGGAWAITTGAGAACSTAASGNSIGGAGGAISFTTGDGGAVSGAVAGTATGGASGGFTWATGTGGAVTATTGTNVGGASGAISILSGTGGAASGATDTGGASGAVTIGSGTGGAGDTGGASGVVTIQTGAAGAGGSPTVGHIAFSPGAAEKWRITSTGVLNSLAGTPSNAATADGSVLATGGFAITDVANAWIDDASQGSGTVTHYIGNQAITTASDVRVKRDIVPFRGSALASLEKAPQLVEFTYAMPGGGGDEGGSAYGPNGRGRYLGFLAQETIDWAPWAVNAGDARDCPTCRGGKKCERHDHFWHVEYQHLVPLLVKGVQELHAANLKLQAECQEMRQALGRLSR